MITAMEYRPQTAGYGGYGAGYPPPQQQNAGYGMGSLAAAGGAGFLGGTLLGPAVRGMAHRFTAPPSSYLGDSGYSGSSAYGGGGGGGLFAAESGGSTSFAAESGDSGGGSSFAADS